MPITTPDIMIEEYRDGKEHFKHVLKCLFFPSIDKAGYKPISPKAKGSDLIHANIIKELETAEMVLCDMSCLNPNVFFEFGIRTALNKPLCIVKDEFTSDVPFDTAILNHYEYKSTLETWEIEEEINQLSIHITNTVELSKDENSLWKFFGFKSQAIPFEGGADVESKLDFLSMRIESLDHKISGFDNTEQKRRMLLRKNKTTLVYNLLEKFLDDPDIAQVRVSDTTIEVMLAMEADESFRTSIEKAIENATDMYTKVGFIKF